MQRAGKRYLVIEQPVEVRDGDKLARLEPADAFSVEFTADFDHPLITNQAFRVTVSDRTFEREVARARTFCFRRDIERMQAAGLAKGGSLENAIVVDEFSILNPEGLRFPDEFARHKVLDAIGDLALFGLPVLGALTAVKSGHALNQALVRKVLAEPGSHRVVRVSARPRRHAAPRFRRSPSPRARTARSSRRRMRDRRDRRAARPAGVARSSDLSAPARVRIDVARRRISLARRPSPHGRSSMNRLNRSRSPSTRRETTPRMSPAFSTKLFGSYSSASDTRQRSASSGVNVTTPEFTAPTRVAPRDRLIRDLLDDLRLPLLRLPPDLRPPVEGLVVELVDLLDPLHEPRELLELRPLVVDHPQRPLDLDRSSPPVPCRLPSSVARWIAHTRCGDSGPPGTAPAPRARRAPIVRDAARPPSMAARA